MSLVNAVLLIFGLGTCARGVYALVTQELELGLCSIAVPIRAGDGRVVAGLNVSMQYSEGVGARATGQVLPALRGAAATIERAIAGGGNLPLLMSRPATGA